MFECRRRAPAPFNAREFFFHELLRDIAWSGRVLAHVPLPKDDDKDDELSSISSEVNRYAVWPEVDRDDWCGEWEQGEDKRDDDEKEVDAKWASSPQE